MTENNPSDEQVNAMADLVQKATDEGKNALMTVAEAGKDDAEKFGILMLASCNIIAAVLFASSKQAKSNAAEATMKAFANIVGPRIEQLANAIEDAE